MTLTLWVELPILGCMKYFATHLLVTGPKGETMMESEKVQKDDPFMNGAYFECPDCGKNIMFNINDRPSNFSYREHNCRNHRKVVARMSIRWLCDDNPEDEALMALAALT